MVMIQMINIGKLTNDMQFDIDYSPLLEIAGTVLLLGGMYLAYNLQKLKGALQ